MKILAIDPGDRLSAYIIYENGDIHGMGIVENEVLINMLLRDFDIFADVVCIEMIASYGMPVGKTVFETCVFIGRLVQVCVENPDRYKEYNFVYRKDVKIDLCNTTRAKDSNVRQAIIDIYGGDRKEVIGTKKHPGPLYGVKKDIWAALAVAIYYYRNN